MEEIPIIMAIGLTVCNSPTRHTYPYIKITLICNTCAELYGSGDVNMGQIGNLLASHLSDSKGNS